MHASLKRKILNFDFAYINQMKEVLSNLIAICLLTIMFAHINLDVLDKQEMKYSNPITNKPLCNNNVLVY